MGSFAFCCNCQPNSQDERPLRDVLTTILGSDPSVGEMAKFRRLFFEAHTIALVDMRSRCEGTSDAQPRRMQLPERVKRMADLKARYPGFLIADEFEFSYALLDKVIDQFERNELRYIQLEECTRRDQELDGLRRDDILKIEVKRDDSLKLEREHPQATARLATDLEIRNAFVRRALAYDAGGLITFSTHELWINKLFRIMQEPSVEGHQPVSLQQAYRADKKLWHKMASDTIGNIQPIIGSPKPLDLAMQKHSEAVDVCFLLLPLPLGNHNPSSSSANSGPSIIQVTSYGKSNPKDSNEKSQPYQKHKSGKGSFGKGGKHGKPDKSPKVSNQGCAYTLSNGKPCCIFFNSASGCNSKNTPTGKRCSRGFHCCGKVLSNKTVCGGDHSMQQCTKA